MDNMIELFKSYPKEKQEQIKEAIANLFKKPAPPAQPQQPAQG
jgi:hypothetical protein